VNPGRVVVVGSINHDIVLRVSVHPRPGETVLARSQSEGAGGKGANQAVAAARLGAATAFIGCAGSDREGSAALAELAGAGVDTSAIRTFEEPTGRAYVQVADDGESSIIVVPGANSALTRQVADRQLARLGLTSHDVVLISLEVPMEAAMAVADQARTVGATVIVNPAPARLLPDALVRGVLLTPNEHEETVIAQGPRTLLGRGASAVITTRGDAGCTVDSPAGHWQIPAVAVPVVDATGAGDTFNGALACWLAGLDELSPDGLAEAAAFAVVAASLSVRAHGARAGQPSRAEVDATLGRS
jgi:ribokinase